MTREDVKKIIRIICNAYPNYKPQDLSETIDTWHFMLEEHSYQNIAVALKAYIHSDTSGFAPSIGQLVGKLKELTTANEMSELEAWSRVQRAIGNSSYNAEEEFAKLPPLIRKAVGHSSNLRQWAQTDNEALGTVVQSNFLRSYREVMRRESDMKMLPSDVKALMKSDVRMLEERTE